MGGDVNYSGELQNALIFQSTPPVWAETVSALGSAGSCIHFNPLRPCGRRRNRSVHSAQAHRFQSTPPVWAETLWIISYKFFPKFQYTPPVWAETELRIFFRVWGIISIHSARVGGDVMGMLRKVVAVVISIHSARVGGDWRGCRC